MIQSLHGQMKLVHTVKIWITKKFYLLIKIWDELEEPKLSQELAFHVLLNIVIVYITLNEFESANIGEIFLINIIT